jgi:hypothetical protein
MRDTLELMLAEVKQGKQINHFIGLVKPVDYTKEYDRVIKMLELSKGTFVHLDERAFAQYVCDEWEWKDDFITANSTYTDMKKV